MKYWLFNMDPVKNQISTISAGAGFFPSTVVNQQDSKGRYIIHQPGYIQPRGPSF